jgi:pimeloyl-ACP methyl ester carboxylesterase
MAGDSVLVNPTHSQTHAITINARAENIWPWLVQMGYRRGGLYSYDWLDRLFGYLDRPSANRILPEFQHLVVGDEIPLGRGQGFPVTAIEPCRSLVLAGTNDGFHWVWQFGLYPLDNDRTRLVSRGTQRIPNTVTGWLFMRVMEPAAFIMTRRMLLGLKERAETMARPTTFKTPEGESAFLAAYHAALNGWPVPHEETDVSTRFGSTHVITTGPKDAPALVLLHGYWATSAMWSRNIADFRDYRVYAIDVMGQPSRSIPDEPVRSGADYVAWLTDTLNALHLDRISLVGMSFGGWLALAYAVTAPRRMQKLVLLSPGGLLPMVRRFSLQGMLMVFVPSRLTVNSFMHWLGFTEDDARAVVDLMYLGLKHFRAPTETARVMPTVFSDEELRTIRVPVLLLIGEHEVMSDPAAALGRARRLIPNVQGELVPNCRHDMCISQHRIVDARVLDFLNDRERSVLERVVA